MSGSLDTLAASKRTPDFLVKTYQVVNDSKTDDIVCWNGKGDGFLVKKEHEFARKILPMYFRHKNFASFVRQLNFYGFRKRATQNKFSEFKHRYFRKNEPQLMQHIQRKTSEASGSVKDTVRQLQSQLSELRTQYDNMWKIQHQVLYILSRYVKSDSDATGATAVGGDSEAVANQGPLLLHSVLEEPVGSDVSLPPLEPEGLRTRSSRRKRQAVTAVPLASSSSSSSESLTSDYDAEPSAPKRLRTASPSDSRSVTFPDPSFVPPGLSDFEALRLKLASLPFSSPELLGSLGLTSQGLPRSPILPELTQPLSPSFNLLDLLKKFGDTGLEQDSKPHLSSPTETKQSPSHASGTGTGLPRVPSNLASSSSSSGTGWPKIDHPGDHDDLYEDEFGDDTLDSAETDDREPFIDPEEWLPVSSASSALVPPSSPMFSVPTIGITTPGARAQATENTQASSGVPASPLVLPGLPPDMASSASSSAAVSVRSLSPLVVKSPISTSLHQSPSLVSFQGKADDEGSPLLLTLPPSATDSGAGPHPVALSAPSPSLTSLLPDLLSGPDVGLSPALAPSAPPVTLNPLRGIPSTGSSMSFSALSGPPVLQPPSALMANVHATTDVAALALPLGVELGLNDRLRVNTPGHPQAPGPGPAGAQGQVPPQPQAQAGSPLQANAALALGTRVLPPHAQLFATPQNQGSPGRLTQSGTPPHMQQSLSYQQELELQALEEAVRSQQTRMTELLALSNAEVQAVLPAAFAAAGGHLPYLSALSPAPPTPVQVPAPLTACGPADLRTELSPSTIESLALLNLIQQAQQANDAALSRLANASLAATEGSPQTFSMTLASVDPSLSLLLNDTIANS